MRSAPPPPANLVAFSQLSIELSNTAGVAAENSQHSIVVRNEGYCLGGFERKAVVVLGVNPRIWCIPFGEIPVVGREGCAQLVFFRRFWAIHERRAAYRILFCDCGEMIEIRGKRFVSGRPFHIDLSR